MKAILIILGAVSILISAPVVSQPLALSPAQTTDAGEGSASSVADSAVAKPPASDAPTDSAPVAKTKIENTSPDSEATKSTEQQSTSDPKTTKTIPSSPATKGSPRATTPTVETVTTTNTAIGAETTNDIVNGQKTTPSTKVLPAATNTDSTSTQATSSASDQNKEVGDDTPKASVPPPVSNVTTNAATTSAQTKPATTTNAKKPTHHEVKSSSHNKPSGGKTTGLLIKVILGLAALLALAYLGGHPSVVKLEKRLGIAHVVTAGFPFIALGLIAAHPAVGVLTDNVLDQIMPLMNFGLGWLGFIIGTQLDMRFLDKLPSGTAVLVFLEAIMPFFVIAIVCGLLMGVFQNQMGDTSFVRDALVLGAAGAMSAPQIIGTRHPGGWSAIAQGWSPTHGLQALVSQLDEIAGVMGLLFLAAYSRPDLLDVAWRLPGTAWVFVSIGLGVAIGVLAYVMLRVPKTNTESLAILLGFVAFGSGLAGYLSLSAIVVCFIAGAIVTNFPSPQHKQFLPVLLRAERPIYMVFLIIAGALWDVGDWRGWALLPAFVIARVLGNWLGITMGESTLDKEDRAITNKENIDQAGRRRDMFSPLSALSIAIVVNVQALYGSNPNQSISWVMTAVIGGAIVTEVLVQLVGTSRLAKDAIVLGSSQAAIATASESRPHTMSDYSPDDAWSPPLQPQDKTIVDQYPKDPTVTPAPLEEDKTIVDKIDTPPGDPTTSQTDNVTIPQDSSEETE